MKVTGLVYIKVNGKLLRSKEGVKIDLGGIERTAIVGNEVIGFSEKVRVPEVECPLADTADLSLKEIQAITGATVTVETDTGKTYVYRDAWCTGAITLASGEGDVECKFQAIACEEML